LGFQAGKSNIDGQYNTAIGNNASYSITGSSYNTTLGYAAGDSNTAGGNNTIIGALADTDANNDSNAIALGYGATAKSGQLHFLIWCIE
jgi:hypothetical protein